MESTPDLLEPVPRAEALVGLPGAFVGRGGAVARHHGPGTPSGQPHQVALGPAGGEPLVGEGVSELVKVDALREARCPRTAPEYLSPCRAMF